MPDNIPFFVPFKENPHFVGRDDDLRRLHTALQGDQTVGIIPAGITGLGGVGKTQLAVRYAYQYAGHYPDGVYWLTAAQELDKVFAEFGQQLWQILPYRHRGLNTGSLGVLARLVHTLFDEGELNTLCFEFQIDYEDIPGGGLARAQKLVTYLQRRERLADLTAYIQKQRPKLVNRPQDELIRLAFTYLRDNPYSLLVLDNLPDPAALHEPVSRDWIPARLPGHVLFTTRRRDVGGCHSIELTVLPEPVALELLLRHHRRRPALQPDHPDHGTARQICALVGYLPLALEVAGAHLGQYDRAPMSQYLAELRQRGAIGVLDDPRIPVTPAVHEAGVAAVLDSQYQSLTSLEARQLLQAAGLFAEAALIPVLRLGLLAGVSEEGTSFFEITLAQVLGYLQDASLIEELKEEQIRLHPLVREFAKHQTPVDQLDNFKSWCATNLVSAFTDLARLEQQCSRRGIDALQEDLLIASQLVARRLGDYREEPIGIPPWRKVDPGLQYNVDPQNPYHLVSRIDNLLRLLQREAHVLRGWNKKEKPVLFAQQVAYRIKDLQLWSLDNVHNLLTQKREPYIELVWSHKRESLALERTLSGHTSWVNAVLVTVDGRQVISGSTDGTVKVWDVQTGQEERTLRGHAGKVLAVAVTPDGRRIISASDDRTVKVWDVQTGRAERTLLGHVSEVRAVAVTPDGRQIISASHDHTIKVWDVQTGQTEHTLGGHASSVNAVAVTPDGRRIISVSTDKTVKVWDLQTGQVEHTLTGHAGWLYAVAVTADGRRIISASDDGMVKVWDMQSGQVERTLRGHSRGVMAVAVTVDGRWIISASDDRTVKVWDVQTGRAERTLIGHADWVRAVAVTPDGRCVISASSDQMVKVWDVQTEQTEYTLSGHTSGVNTVAVTPDGRRVISASHDQTVKVWDVQTGQEERILSDHTRAVTAVTVTPDGRRIVSASDDRTVKVWDIQTGQVERTLNGHAGGVNGVAVTTDGRRIISASDDRTVKVWDLQTGQVERTLSGHTDWVLAVAVTPDGQQIISTSKDQTVKVWDVQTGQAERTLSGHSRRVNMAVVTPDGRKVISASHDQTVKVWDIQTGQVERTLRGHASMVNAVAVTADGRQIISASTNRAVKVWDVQSGVELASLTLDGPLQCVGVAPDGVTLFTGDEVGNIYCLRLVNKAVP